MVVWNRMVPYHTYRTILSYYRMVLLRLHTTITIALFVVFGAWQSVRHPDRKPFGGRLINATRGTHKKSEAARHNRAATGNALVLSFWFYTVQLVPQTLKVLCGTTSPSGDNPNDLFPSLAAVDANETLPRHNNTRRHVQL